MTIQQGLTRAEPKLAAVGITSSRLDVELLMGSAIGRNRSWIQTHSADRMDPTELKNFEKLVERRIKREPIDQIIGHREFYGIDFKVSSAVLSPRVETEPIVEQVIKNAPRNTRLIDIGTGCGALAIAIAKHRSDLIITATDISPAALKIATENVQIHHTPVKLIKSDLFKNATGRFQTVVANLPYLRDDAELMPEVKNEPSVALFGGPDGLDVYRRFFKPLPNHLESGGRVFIEADPWLHPELIELARSKGLGLGYQDYFILGFKS